MGMNHSGTHNLLEVSDLYVVGRDDGPVRFIDARMDAYGRVSCKVGIKSVSRTFRGPRRSTMRRRAGAWPPQSPERIIHLVRMSWKLGRVAGIDLFLHPTFLLVFCLFRCFGRGLSAVLSRRLRLRGAARAGPRPDGAPVRDRDGGYHALPDRRRGPARADARRPGAELLIALAGPAVNFAIVAGLSVSGCSASARSVGRTAWSTVSSTAVDRQPGPGPVQPDPRVPDGRRARAACPAERLARPGPGHARSPPRSARRLPWHSVCTACFTSSSFMWPSPPSSTWSPGPRSAGVLAEDRGRNHEAMATTTRTRASGRHRRAIAGFTGAMASGSSPRSSWRTARGTGLPHGPVDADRRARCGRSLRDADRAALRRSLQPASLDAIENEDWGRDLLLSRFLEIPAEALAAAGIQFSEPESCS